MIQKIKELQIWKKRIFCVFMAVFMLLFLALNIKIAMPNKEYQYEGISFWNENSPLGEQSVYEGIVLPVGSYRIELEYSADTDLIALCNVKDGTVFTGGLLCNGEHMYSSLDTTSYDMWLYEDAEGLQVTVDYGGKGNLETGALRIIETNQLWTMLLSILLFGALVVCAFIIFYYYDQKYSVAIEKKNAFFFITLIALIASLPYLCGFVIAGADLTYHLHRIEGVKDGLLTGQFPVRLEPRWLYDHGYANGIFYCNLLLYIPAFLRMLGFTITASYDIYCVILNFATAWISYYCFGKMFKSRSIGIVSSALYTLSIFRIYKLIIAGAVGEGSAVTFMPLVIYGLYRVFTEDCKKKEYKTAWVPLMLGYAGLIQTHVLSCEITALVTIIVCLLNIRKFGKISVWLEFIKGAIGAAALSLWYLVPFLDYYITQDVHIKHVSGRTIQSSGLLFAQVAFHFWRNGSNIPSGTDGMQDAHPIGLGFVLVVALGLFLIMWFNGAFRKSGDGKVSFVKKIALTGTVLILMSLNVFPWDKIHSLHPIAASLVSSLQFPNRFLGWGTVCSVLVFGFLLWHFARNKSQVYWGMVGLAIVGVTTSGMYLLDHVKANQNYFELYNQESMGFGYISGAEYLIEGTDTDLLSFAKPKTSAGVELFDYRKEGLKAEFKCASSTGDGGYVDVPMLMYKGYRAVDAKGQEIKLSFGENNVIRVHVPAGYEGDIKVEFVSPFYWRISEVISITAVLFLMILWWKNQRKIYVEANV